MYLHTSRGESWKEAGVHKKVSLLQVAWSPERKKEVRAACAAFLFLNSPSNKLFYLPKGRESLERY